MHVILEGVLPLHSKLLLLHCVFEEHLFTLKVANRLILEFEYGYSERKNMPRALDSDHLRSSDSKLSQSGMCCHVHVHVCVFVVCIHIAVWYMNLL